MSVKRIPVSIRSLRDAIAFLDGREGQLIRSKTAVDPAAELSGIYRYVGAGGTVMRPTTVDGPAMLFENVKGHADASVLIGLLASRSRVAAMLGCAKEDLGRLLCECVHRPIAPVMSDEPAPAQEVVHLASDADFDLFHLIPAPTNTPVDAGPYITLGMCYATHPDTGLSDVTIHRMCIQSRDELSIFLQPGSRHIGAMAERATALGRPLPISVSIGVDPAIPITSCFEPPTTPLGFDELSIAGALRGEAVRLCRCLTVNEAAIANAEYVIEGEILPGSNHVVEDQNSHTGYAMPEFPGYNGRASHECWLLKVKAVTHRRYPIMQTCIGPSEEHVNMAGIPTEASILALIDKALPGKVKNVYAHRAGGGKYMAVLQCVKAVHTDEGKQRQAALLAFSAFPELKHVILVDEDVDIFDTNDVLWAMNTRFQGDRDIITIPGVRCHPLDPSSSPAYSPSIPDVGVSTKTIFDCTVPFHLKDRFRRASFMELDYRKWLNDRVIVGISGASGALLAVDVVRSLHAAGMEVHLVVSRAGALTLRHECGLSVESLAPCCAAVYDNGDIGAAIASGSFRTRGMIVVPASMKTVAGVASGYSDSLLLRAADVTLKERRRLVVVPRECPLSEIHLRNLLEITRAGAVVLPPVISCYSRPESVAQMLHHLTGKILDLLEIETADFCRWEGECDAP